MAHRPDPSEYRQGESELRVPLADGRTLACLALGRTGERPVLYFHGYPGSRLEGRLAAEPARRLGLWLLAPDRPGFGASTFQPGRTIDAWATDVAELADRLGLERFDIVGVSGGGPYALACAARIPQRLKRVALVGAVGPWARMPPGKEMVVVNRLALRLAAHLPPLARSVVRVAAPLVRNHPKWYLKLMRSAASPADREILADEDYRTLFADSTAEALRQGGRGVAWELSLLAGPWGFSLPEISMPVRIWQGLEDTIVPVTMARNLAKALPHSQTRFLPGEGHLSLIVNHLSPVLAEMQS